MRFYENGPSIPNKLLEDQKLGKVIFVCGAGVSKQVGLPDFNELTQYVLESILADDDSPAMRYFKSRNSCDEYAYPVPFDTIYSELYKQYGETYINSIIAKRLSDLESRVVDFTHFCDIVTISSSSTRNVQIVTTNFDRLLERSFLLQPEKTICPSHSPNDPISSTNGIVYLHGRICDDIDEPHNFVLNRSNFGKAYLLNGFTLNLIKYLIDKYTVIFLGYQLGDPMVQYLFEGLAASGGDVTHMPYVFVTTQSTMSIDDWKNFGVNTISYKTHSELWKTIGIWAGSITNNSFWEVKMLQLARMSPSKLRSFERGQVAYFLCSTDGSLKIDKENISTEWLLVLDGLFRSNAPLHDIDRVPYGSPAKFDYFLDDDPEIATLFPSTSIGNVPNMSLSMKDINTSSSNDPSELPFFDFLCSDPSSKPLKPFSGILSSSLLSYSDDPSIVTKNIFNWISRSLDNPFTVWWILWRGFSNTYLFNQIKCAYESGACIDTTAQIFWCTILRHMRRCSPMSKKSISNNTLFEIIDVGWDNVPLGEFVLSVEYFLYPIFTPSCLTNFSSSSMSWERLKILFDKYWDECCCEVFKPLPLPPTPLLLSIFAVLENHFLKCVEIRRKLELPPKACPTCYPGRYYIGDISKTSTHSLFQLFVDVVTELIKENKEFILSRIENWPHDDLQYFEKLQLYMMTNRTLYSTDDVCTYLTLIDDKYFWHSAIRRELLSLISKRWSDFSAISKDLIIARFLPQLQSDSPKTSHASSIYNIHIAATCLVWLVKNGIELSPSQNNIFATMPHLYAGKPSSEIPDDLGYGMRLIVDVFGSSTLLGRNVNDLDGLVENEEVFDFETASKSRPFAGLVKVNPRKALAFLTSFAKRKEYPDVLWSALFSEWSKSNNPRLTRVLMQRVLSIPSDHSSKFVRSLVEWLDKMFSHLSVIDSILTWRVYDYTINLLQQMESEAQLGEQVTPIRHESRPDKSAYLFETALNSEVGRILHGVFSALPLIMESNDGKIPPEILARFSNLISLDGYIGKDSTSMLCHKFVELLGVAEEWAMTYLDPCFDKSHPNVCFAWSGLLTSNYFPPIDENSQVYKNILHTLTYNQDHIDVGRLSEYSARIIVLLCVEQKYLEAKLEESDIRMCFRGMGIENRRSAIHQLSGIANDDSEKWTSVVLPFIRTIWPKDKFCRNPQECESWLHLLSGTGLCFPKLFHAIRYLLVPIDGDNFWLLSFLDSESDEPTLLVEYPLETLELLDIVVSTDIRYVPYGLDKALSAIEKGNPNLRKDARFVQLSTLII